MGDGHRRAAGPPKVGGVPPVSVCPPGPPRPGGRAPENSLPAFRRALERGYGVELDVHLTGDGRLAVIHDKNLKRTAGVDAEVSGLSAAELKAFQLEGTGETIPLLEEVLPMFQGGPPLLVELKADYYDVSELVETAVNTLDPVPGELLH